MYVLQIVRLFSSSVRILLKCELYSQLINVDPVSHNYDDKLYKIMNTINSHILSQLIEEF